MTDVADSIMRRFRGNGRGRRVFAPSDFLDLGFPASVRQALARLARTGKVRRVDRGLYDLPRYSEYLRKLVVADTQQAVDAIVRRDGIRVARGGLIAGNDLHLTNCLPAQIVGMTDGASRNAKVSRRAPDWLGPLASQDPTVIPTLRRVLPDQVKYDLIKNCGDLPRWAVPIAHSVAAQQQQQEVRDHAH